MASGRDVRDIFGLPAGGDSTKTPVQKRPKPAAPARRIQGVAREVAALYGERPPPVAVYEEKKTYRAKRQSTGPAKKWIPQPFTNQARTDALVLKHWRRKDAAALSLSNDEDTAMEDGEDAVQPVVASSDYLKYNVETEIPTFTDDEYEAHLRSGDWSRGETDYLFELVKDYAYRWPVIWDRYDYQPSANSHFAQERMNGDSTALASLPFSQPRERSMEELKARFYDISAKLMRLRIPEVQMDADQYQHYETLTKFNPELEGTRKKLATALMNRTLDEVKEEEFLLTELQRINMAANRLDAEREELRARLEAPAPNPQVPAGLQSFQSSQQLGQLFNSLFQADRSKKKHGSGATGPGRLSLSATDTAGTPTSAQQAQLSANRKQSMAQPPPQTPIRQLPPHQEYRFNVSTHDRLTSGVTFGSDKLLKMRQAKSNVQTQKIATALAELGISEVISIPTSKVGEVFEGLVSKVGKLLDVRKVREKEEGECRVLEAMKARRAGEPQGDRLNGNGASNSNFTPGKSEAPQSSRESMGSGANGNEDEDEDDAEGEEDDVEGEEDSGQTSEAVSRAVSGHKRSASVLSHASNSNKRARK